MLFNEISRSIQGVNGENPKERKKPEIGTKVSRGRRGRGRERKGQSLVGGRDKGGANELIQGMDGMTCSKEAAMFVSTANRLDFYLARAIC